MSSNFPSHKWILLVDWTWAITGTTKTSKRGETEGCRIMLIRFSNELLQFSEPNLGPGQYQHLPERCICFLSTWYGSFYNPNSYTSFLKCDFSLLLTLKIPWLSTWNKMIEILRPILRVSQYCIQEWILNQNQDVNKH